MTDKRSLLEFPCEFPIKAVGRCECGIEMVVVDIVRRHAPDFQADRVSSRPSSGGRFTAVTVTIHAQGQDQLDAIYRELSAHRDVIMAL